MIFANAPPSEGLFFGKSLEVQTFPVSFDRKYAEPRECSQKITDTQIITAASWLPDKRAGHKEVHQ